MADQIEAGFSLNDGPKRAENTPYFHHARSYHRLRGIFNLRHLGLFKKKTLFLKCFSLFSTGPDEAY